MATTTSSTTSIFNSIPEKKQSLIGAVGGAYSAYKNYTGPDINYDILNIRAEQKEIEANNVELQVTQQANNLRDQFNEAAGTYQYKTARRGVKVGEGSSAQNVEASSRDLGYDVETMTGNAKFKADQLRAEGDRLSMAAGDQREINKWDRLGELFGTVNKLSNLDWGSKESSETTKGETKTVKGKNDSKKTSKKVETVKTNDKVYGALSMQTSGAQGAGTSSRQASGPQGAPLPEQFNLADNPGGEAYLSNALGAVDATKMDKLSSYHKNVIAKEMAIDGENYMAIAKKLGLTMSQVASLIDDGGDA